MAAADGLALATRMVAAAEAAAAAAQATASAVNRPAAEDGKIMVEIASKATYLRPQYP